MAARRGKSQARRNNDNGTPGWVWLVAGVAIAAVVFLAAPNLFKGEGNAGQSLGDLTHIRQFVTGPALFAFFDARIPADIVNAAGFEAWHAARATQQDLEGFAPQALLAVTSTTGMGELPDNLMPLYSSIRDTLPAAWRGLPSRMPSSPTQLPALSTAMVRVWPSEMSDSTTTSPERMSIMKSLCLESSSTMNHSPAGMV